MRRTRLRGEVGSFVVTGVAVVTVLAAVAWGSPAASRSVGSTPDASGPTIALAAPDPGYDSVTMDIDIEPDGTANWTVTYHFQLHDEAGREAFERAKRNVSDPPVNFTERMRNTAVKLAEERTGRQMKIWAIDTVVNTSFSGGEGFVRYHFGWSDFVDRSPEGRVVVGDAIGGLVFDENGSLTIGWDESFSNESVSPTPDDSGPGWVRWEPPLEFTDDQPRVELASPGGGLPVLPAAGALGLVIAILGGWYSRTRWRDSDEEPDIEEVPTTPPDELLTDEERVLQLLEAKGGRMKQQELIDAVDWSRTKTSDVVNEMHEAEQIEVYQLGRENVLALPGEIEI